MSDIEYGDSHLIGTRDGKLKNVETGEIIDPEDIYDDLDVEEEYPYEIDERANRYDCE